MFVFKNLRVDYNAIDFLPLYRGSSWVIFPKTCFQTFPSKRNDSKFGSKSSNGSGDDPLVVFCIFTE